MKKTPAFKELEQASGELLALFKSLVLYLIPNLSKQLVKSEAP